MIRPLFLFVLLLAAGPLAAQNAPPPAAKPAAPAMFPFVLPWDDAAPAVTDLSAWLDAPAGGRGFLTARDGHLFAGDKRIRLLGVNVVGAANFPTHADADTIAGRLAKFGIGCVRLQALDAAPAPKGLLQADGVSLAPGPLDALDYFVAALKKRGVYVDLPLHVGRLYPGLPEGSDMPDGFKGVDQFQPRLIALQRDYARDLLTHVNAYTRSDYAHEPAVAFLEINDDDSLLHEWWNGTLDEMPALYAADLQPRWNAWLAAAYGTDDKLRAAWNAHETPAGDEKLKNVMYSPNTWLAQSAYPCVVKAAAAPGPDALTGTWVRVSRLGKEMSAGKWVRYNLSVDSKTTYVFTFQARSDQPRWVTISVKEQERQSVEVFRTRVRLTTAWQKYRIAFTPTSSLGNAQFGFLDLAGDVSDWYFADLSLKPAGFQGLHAGEHLGTVALFPKRDFPARTPEAQRDWVAFLMAVESTYWDDMARYLKDRVHARSLVIGTAVNDSPFPIQARLDVVAVQGDWQPPRFPRKPSDPSDWVVRNVSLLGESDGGVIGQMGARRVAGKPFVCTGFGASAPNTYSAEALLLLGAYAALQDWDAIFADAYCRDLDALKSGMFGSFLDIAQHPCKMATLPAAVAMFVRGDVAAAVPHVVGVPSESVIDRIRRSGPALSAMSFGVRQEETLRHPVELALGGAAAPGAAPVQSVLPGVTSDTLDLRWDRQADGGGLVTIDTRRSAGVIGFAAERTFPLMQTTIAVHGTQTNWATVNATVIEGDDFRTARRVLVVATGYAANTGMAMKDEKGSKSLALGRAWGTAPTRVEGVSATITLPRLPAAKAWALDERGQHKSEVPLKTIEGKTVLEIGPAWKTLWYEVEAAAP